MRHSRLIAYTLIVTLMASVIAGALGVTLHFAKASVPSAGYFDDLVNEALPYVPNQYAADFVSKINDIKSNLDVSTSVVFVLCNYEHTKFYFGYYKVTSGTNMSNFYWYSDNNNLRFKKHGNNTNYAFFLGAAVCVFDSYQSFTYSGSSLANSSFNTGTFGVDTNNLYFPSASYAAGSIDCYSNAELQDSNGVYMTVNLFSGSQPAPPEVQFSVRAFWLGERQYLTVVDQYLMYSMIDYNNEGETLHSFRALFYTDADDEVSIYLPYEDTVLIESGNDFIDGLSNVSPEGVYAWDITNKGLLSVMEMFYYDHVDGSTGDEYRGYATNCPYSLDLDDPGTNGQPDSYTQMWSTFNEYVNNYNTTHVIPDDLSSWLFGISGSNIYPASVSVPLEVWNNNRTVNDPASFADIHTWKWWLLENNLNINFELMDVVIVSESTSGEYSLIYYYDDRLSTPWKPVDNVSFDELVELFDVIIVVPDNDNCLIGNTWWQNALSVILTVLGWDNTISLLNSLAVSGTSSLGVQYVDERPDENAHVLDAFCIVTKKCLEKQKMLIFSDYLPKLYKLMSDYVSSEDNWKTDFLKWSSSMFYGINTLDGTLNKILSTIESLKFDINSKLDQLIENTSEDEPNHWFPSLWLWILQFKPSNNDFSVALDVYDDNWDNFPLLPAPSAIPALPTIQGG